MRLTLLSIAPAAATLLTCGVNDTTRTAATPLCEISTSGVVSGSKPELCDHLVRRYRSLVDTTAIAGSATLFDSVNFASDRSSTQTWAMRWSKLEMFPDGLDRAPNQEEVSIFWHEIGHGWLSPLMAGGRSLQLQHVYGTEAPDWLDEAWAVWAEPDARRSQRLARVPADIPASLVALTEMVHPAIGTASVASSVEGEMSVTTSRIIDGPCKGDCSFLPDSVRSKYRVSEIRRFGSGRVDTISYLSDTDPNAATKATLEAEHFYPLSYSLLRYIRETGGEAAVRELIARYRIDPTPRAEALANLPGMPSTIEAVEAGWHAFLAERRPEPK